MSGLIIWTYDWVPEGSRGFVRDLRLRLACEETYDADMKSAMRRCTGGVRGGGELGPLEVQRYVKAGMDQFDAGVRSFGKAFYCEDIWQKHLFRKSLERR
jgi:hypothetical protein